MWTPAEGLVAFSARDDESDAAPHRHAAAAAAGTLATAAVDAAAAAQDRGGARGGGFGSDVDVGELIVDDGLDARNFGGSECVK